MVFVTVKDQGDLRNIPFVEPVTGDPTTGPFSQMAVAFLKPIAEFARLTLRSRQQPTKRFFGRW